MTDITLVDRIICAAAQAWRNDGEVLATGSPAELLSRTARTSLEEAFIELLPEAQRAKLVEMIPAGRLGTPDDIAHAVKFLCDEHAGYVTGTTLHVNGGMYFA